MAPSKINVKERVTDGEIDLSMSELYEVPVKEIAVFRRVYSLDLSNNELKALPINFAPLLTHITKLDLSKNQLTELPENFGDLVKLRHLDLYQNKLLHLPLSVSKLKNLKWLDLKDNPLVPAVAKVAGPCLDPKECQDCARDIVKFFAQIQEQVNSELLEMKNKQQLEAAQQKQQESVKKPKKKKEKKKPSRNLKNGAVSEEYEDPWLHERGVNFVDRPHTGFGPKPLKNKKEKSKKPIVGGCSFCKTTRWLIMFTIMALFISTSIDCTYTAGVKSGAVQIFNQSVSLLPSNLQTYALLGGNYVKIFHENTGQVTRDLATYVTSSEYYPHVVAFGNASVIRVRELGNHVANNENYLRLRSMLITFGNDAIIKIRELYNQYAT